MTHDRLRLERSSSKEALVVAHRQLALHLFHRFDGDAHHDEDRHTGEADGNAPDEAGQGGNHCDEGQIDRTREGDAVEGVGEIPGGGAARPDAGNESALSLQHLGLPLRVELDRRVEVGEEDDQREQDHHVPDAHPPGLAAEVAVDPPAHPGQEPVVRRNRRHQQRREQHHRRGEDHRDHAGGVHLQGDVGGLAAHHPPAPDPLGELDGDPPLRLVDVDDRHDHHDEGEDDGAEEGITADGPGAFPRSGRR